MSNTRKRNRLRPSASARRHIEPGARRSASRARPPQPAPQAAAPARDPGTPFRLPRWAALGVIAAVALGVGLYAWVSHQGPVAGQVATTTPGMPTYRVVEGQSGYPYPYDPQVLHIKAGHPFAIRLVDHLGGCGLDTLFPGLGQGGGTAVAHVPVGDTKTITLQAAHPGTYTYHCGSNMYYGKIIATWSEADP